VRGEEDAGAWSGQAKKLLAAVASSGKL